MNTSELISAVKIMGSFPTADDLFSDSDFLVLMNMAMHSEINPILMKLNEEYFLQTKDYTIAAGLLYRLPTRVISVRDLKLVDGAGNLTDIARNFEEDRALNRTGYYIIRNSIELSADITQPTLRMKYFASPSKLVATTAAAQIMSINTGANTITASSVPSTYSNGVSVDFIQNKNPYDQLSIDQTLVSVSGTTLSFSSLPADLVIGDWVTLANESPIPLVQEELQTLLAHATLLRCLSSKKDQAYVNENQKFEMLKANVINMLDPRVNNSSVKMRSGILHNYFTSRRY